MNPLIVLFKMARGIWVVSSNSPAFVNKVRSELSQWFRRHIK